VPRRRVKPKGPRQLERIVEPYRCEASSGQLSSRWSNALGAQFGIA
jgi:hypothetical protein